MKHYRSVAYRKAVAFIALNDGPGDVEATDAEWVAGLTTVVLASEVWNIPAEVVAQDVIKIRLQEVAS